MVEVSRLRDLDIYTVQGKYVGRVEDVILNIRLGTISKLVIRALEPEKNKQVGFRSLLRGSFQMVPEEDEMRSFSEGLLTISFDKVSAIGDIMLINAPEARPPHANQNPNARGEVPITPDVPKDNIPNRDMPSA